MKPIKFRSFNWTHVLSTSAWQLESLWWEHFVYIEVKYTQCIVTYKLISASTSTKTSDNTIYYTWWSKYNTSSKIILYNLFLWEKWLSAVDKILFIKILNTFLLIRRTEKKGFKIRNYKLTVKNTNKVHQFTRNIHPTVHRTSQSLHQIHTS